MCRAEKLVFIIFDSIKERTCETLLQMKVIPINIRLDLDSLIELEPIVEVRMKGQTRN